MSGPDYPRGPQPGSNAIGLFALGVSPIGDIPPSFDWWKTVVSQYANSPILTQLLSNFSQYVDQTKDLSDFFDLVWNLDTAQGWGLDVLGRIVGVGRTLHLSESQDYLGFEEANDVLRTPFNQAPLFAGSPLTSNFDLTDTAYRVLIFAKALSNISDGSIQSINQLLLNLFPHRGNCYVADGLDMSMTYTFEFVLSPVELTIVQSSGVLAKPAGVSVTVVQPPA